VTLSLDLLPARHGDALVLEYGAGRDTRRILIDGGPVGRATMRTLETAVPDLELLVVTHIDADHIGGVVSLLERADLPLRVRDVWFNGWEHLPGDQLGAKQAERLSAAIVRRRLPWNHNFDGAAVMVPDDGPLPVRELPGGLRLTLLGPTRAALVALRPVWSKEVIKAGLVPGAAATQERAGQPDLLGDGPLEPEALAAEPYVDDPSAANGASITFLAEYEGRNVLLTGDANGESLAAGLRRLAAERGTSTVRVDAVKVPHHGSRFNVSPEMLDLIECDRFLFSTNGNIFGHPDRVAVARIVIGAPGRTLEFNYRTSVTEAWESRRTRREFRYTTVFPENDGRLRVTL
jgi:hypothetical protein